MFKIDIVNRMKARGAMTVVRIESIERGRETARGCLQGGVDVTEVSHTFPNTGDVVAALNHEFGKTMPVGTGTILDAEIYRIAILVGVGFVITPSFNREVACMCDRYQIPYAPGYTTVTEMLEALEIGASYVEASLISNSYGPQPTKVIQAPIPEMLLMASGGASPDDLEEWLENGISCTSFGGLLTNGT